MEAVLTSPLGRNILGSSPLKLGRSSDNAVVLQDPQSSSRHAEIAPGPDGASYTVTDLGSTNGTYVNEQRLSAHTPQTLNHGDTVRIGNTTFQYEVAGAIDATMRASGHGDIPSYEPTMFAGPSSTDSPAFGNPSSPGLPPMAPPAAPFGAPSAYPSQPPVAPMGYPQAAQPGFPPPQQGFPYTPGYQQPGGFSPPQQGFPGGGMGMPPGQTPPKKSSSGMTVAIILIVVLVIGGGGFGIWFMNRSTPEKTLAAYCSALLNNDAQAAFDLMSKRAQEETSVSDMQEGFALIESFAGGFSSCTYSNVQETGDTATATVTTELGKPPEGVPASSDTDGPLIKEDGVWKLDSGNDLEGI